MGGAFTLEAYSPRQLQYDTGPPVAELLMDLSELRHELAGLHFHSAHEIEREVVEGKGHTSLDLLFRPWVSAPSLRQNNTERDSKCELA